MKEIISETEEKGKTDYKAEIIKALDGANEKTLERLYYFVIAHTK